MAPHRNRLAAAFAACATVLTLAAPAGAYEADCTDPAVNEYFRSQMFNARTEDGKPIMEGVSLSLVGNMQPVAQNGAQLTCQARVRVTVQDGSSALRSTTVYLTIRNGDIEHLDFVMAPNH